ncbi:MAG TPA: hypothetical protein VF444_15920 [Pseudonocardiaceae bacterium]
MARPLPVPIGFALAFAGYFVMVLPLTVVPVWHPVGAALLLVVAVSVGCRVSVPVAMLIGGMGWLFYSGFVTHTHGQLGIVGPSDAEVAVLFVGAAMIAAGARVAVVRFGARRPPMTAAASLTGLRPGRSRVRAAREPGR